MSIGAPIRKSKTTTTTTNLLTIPHVFETYQDWPEGKHSDQRVRIQGLKVQEIKVVSPRLTFLRVVVGIHDTPIISNCTHSSSKNSCNKNVVLELLLRERDGFLSQQDIAEMIKAITAVDTSPPGANATNNILLECCGFPERLSAFDGDTFFPHLQPRPLAPICLHVTAAKATTTTTTTLSFSANNPNEQQHEERDTVILVDIPEKEVPDMATTTTTASVRPGRMPPLQAQQSTNNNNNKGTRRGNINRDRGGIFAAWVLETFGLDATAQPHPMEILDVAGGSGQLAFQLGVRRGFNISVVDPRPLRLASDQQRTLHYHRQQQFRVLPEGRDPALPPTDYGHHFARLQHPKDNDTTTTTTWLVGGDNARVRHVATWFDLEFRRRAMWQDATVIVGMHPDEATEDLVDLALADDKPFAIVPCCVFWKQNPNRWTPSGKTVRTWEQFCTYLAAKDRSRIQVTSLPFPGRNVVLYSRGGNSKTRIET